MYVKYFGADYQPEPYIVEEYKRARNHKHYMTSRLICVNDVYAFDPNAKVNLDDFVDIIGRHFKQPKEGLGCDRQPVRAHVAHHHVADAITCKRDFRPWRLRTMPQRCTVARSRPPNTTPLEQRSRWRR